MSVCPRSALPPVATLLLPPALGPAAPHPAASSSSFIPSVFHVPLSLLHSSTRRCSFSRKPFSGFTAAENLLRFIPRILVLLRRTASFLSSSTFHVGNRSPASARAKEKEKRGFEKKSNVGSFLMEKRTPPQEEDAPVESREPRLSLQRKLFHGGRGRCGLQSSFKNTEISGSKFLHTSCVPAESPLSLR